MATAQDRSEGILKALWVAFAVLVVGRLVDFQWHVTHSGFETGADQFKAHWLMWIGTLFILGVAVWALRAELSRDERRGYVVVLWSSVLFVVINVVHFIQHLNHDEVDWSHFLLALANAATVVGVLMVTLTRIKSGPVEDDLRG